MNQIRFEIFKGADDQYWWRLRDSNGKVIAGGLEGFAGEFEATRAARNVVDSIGKMMGAEFHKDMVIV